MSPTIAGLVGKRAHSDCVVSKTPFFHYVRGRRRSELQVSMNPHVVGRSTRPMSRLRTRARIRTARDALWQTCLSGTKYLAASPPPWIYLKSHEKLLKYMIYSRSEHSVLKFYHVTGVTLFLWNRSLNWSISLHGKLVDNFSLFLTPLAEVTP